MCKFMRGGFADQHCAGAPQRGDVKAQLERHWQNAGLSHLKRGTDMCVLLMMTFEDGDSLTATRNISSCDAKATAIEVVKVRPGQGLGA